MESIFPDIIPVKIGHQQGKLTAPWINDKKELIFRSFDLLNKLDCNQSYEIHCHQEMLDIYQSKHYLFSLRLNRTDSQNILNLSNTMKRDIAQLGKRFEKDTEAVILLKGNGSMVMTSKTIMKKGHYSPKYNGALVYYINQWLGTDFKTITELEESLNQTAASHRKFFERLPSVDENVYVTTFRQLKEANIFVS